MTNKKTPYNLTVAYQESLKQHAAERAAETKALQAILMGDDARHTPKLAQLPQTPAQKKPRLIEEMTDEEINSGLFG